MSIPRPGYDYCPSCYGGPGGFHDECRCSKICRECGGLTNHTTAQHLAAELACPDCGVTTNDGELCGECLSERASYYVPDEIEEIDHEELGDQG